MQGIFQKLDRYFPSGWRVAVLDHIKGRWIVKPAISTIGYLKAENAGGRHILIQPEDASCYLLADDLSWELILSHHRRTDGTWKPGRMVVETSPRNFQVWIHGQSPLSLEDKRHWLKKLGSDPAADPNNRWGRCPGFRNCRDKYRNSKGGYPLSRLIWIDWAKRTQIPRIEAPKATPRPRPSGLVPGGLPCLAAVILVQANLLTPWLPKIAMVYPPLVLTAGLLLGWRFNRSRLIFAVLVLAIADRSLQWLPAASPSGRLVYDVVAVLLPVNLALLSLLKERGLLTAHGIWRICLLLAQPLIVAAMCQPQFNSFAHCSAVTAFLEYPFLKVASPLPQPAMLATAVGSLLITYAIVKQKGAVENGFFWALVTVCLALSTRKATITTFYFSTAGLILVVAVIEASYAMAFRDELTGLPARRALNELILKLGTRYTVAMVDIDFFKKFNDTYGHDVGDQVLRMVASKISGVTGGGKAFRYGGEEFAVIYPGKSSVEAIPHLDQLRMAVESGGFIVRSQSRPSKKPDKPKAAKTAQKKVKLTISIGVAERNGNKHATPQDVVKAADKALYKAKKAGRNRVST